MPIYIYKREDGTTFEVRQSMNDDPLTEDPDDGQPIRRVITGGKASLIANQRKMDKQQMQQLKDTAGTTLLGDYKPIIKRQREAYEKKLRERNGKPLQSDKITVK